MSLIRSRAPLLSDYIKWKVQQLCEWAENPLANAQQDAKKSAREAGSAQSAANPPGWRPAVMSCQPPRGCSFSGETTPARIPIEDITRPADDGGKTLEDAGQRNSLSLSSSRDRETANEEVAREGMHPKVSEGSQLSARTPPEPETRENAQGTIEDTLTNAVSTGEALEAEQHKRDASEAASENGGENQYDPDLHPGKALDGNATSTSDAEGDEGHGEDEEKVHEEDESSDEDNRPGSERGEKNGVELEHEAEEDEDDSEGGGDTPRRAVSEDGQDHHEHGEGHASSEKSNPETISQPISATGTSLLGDDATDTGSEAEQNAGNSTETSDCVERSASVRTAQQGEQINRTVQQDEASGAHFNKPSRGLDGDGIVLAQGLPQTQQTNGRTTNTPKGTSAANGNISEDSTGEDDSSLDAESDSGSDDDSPNLTIHQPKQHPKATGNPAKRTSTRISDTDETPTKRRKLSTEVNRSLAGIVVKNVPERLIQPPRVMQLVEEMLGDSHKGSAIALAKFFFAIASPFALERLRQACLSVRDSQRGGLFSEEVGLRQSVQALDCIDMQEHVSPILRRYHLVQLVKYRDEMQSQIMENAAHTQPSLMKYGLRKQTTTKELAGTKRAAGLTLERLTCEAYPEHRLEAGRKTAQYTKHLKLLQNRLYAGHNWNVLQAKFGIGILALVPAGADAGFSNTE